MPPFTGLQQQEIQELNSRNAARFHWSNCKVLTLAHLRLNLWITTLFSLHVYEEKPWQWELSTGYNAQEQVKYDLWGRDLKLDLHPPCASLPFRLVFQPTPTFTFTVEDISLVLARISVMSHWAFLHDFKQCALMRIFEVCGVSWS